MDVPDLTTERLLLRPLSPDDSAFIFELLNTAAWKQFIGDRNMTSEAVATAYIRNILSNPDTHYQVVERKTDRQPIGIITLIQRSYLDHPDIGFAFLPGHFGRGYAYEAASSVIRYLLTEDLLSCLLAITLPDNTASVKLLEKLGLHFEKEQTVSGSTQYIYSASSLTLREQI